MLPLTTVIGYVGAGIFVKVAVTVLSALIKILVSAVPVASPLQPLKVQPFAAVAFRSIVSP